MNYEEIDKHHVWHPYDSLPSKNRILPVKKTFEQTIVLENDNELIDAMSSWWSAIHGYNHPALLFALQKQALVMPHVMFGGLTHEPASTLCYKLSELTGLSSIFLCDSGSVSVEVALKTAILYQKAKGKNVNQFIALENSYHGDTLGCMGVCDPENSMHSLYGEYLPKNYFTSIDNLENTIKIYHNKIAGVILEPIVQGAGGMKIHSSEYLKVARKLCTKYDLVLIIDEIATGFGHTGKMFACEWANIKPDIMTLGKSLTGGIMTLAAMCTTKNISDVISNSEIGALMHGPTFMGNALACSIANTSIDLLLNSNWKEKVQHIEKIFKNELASFNCLDLVKETRCIGVIGVVEINTDKYSKEIQDLCIQEGVWIRPFKNLVYSIVAYTIKEVELLKIINSMKFAIEKVNDKYKNIL